MDEEQLPPKATADDRPPGWERELLEKLAFATLKEQRAQRRWRIFFRFMTLFIVIAFLAVIAASVSPLGDFDTTEQSGGNYTALVDLYGVIADGSDASADRMATGLRRAFNDDNVVGVILRINSPGGSPVQSSYINTEIKRLREKHPDKKLYAVVTDLCASGGYYVAAAADEIYVNESSLIGSIGVVSGGFGVVDAMGKLGVERRLYTAGSNKGMLDPFLPENEVEIEHWKRSIDVVYQEFVRVVKEGRGERLSNNPDLFSGLIWSGKEAIELGLADKIGSAGYVAREVIGEEDIVDFTPRSTYLERLSEQLGASIADTLANTLGLNQQQPIQLR
ncbi:MAG: S49 family peptidase [Pseudomonadota bacterium]